MTGLIEISPCRRYVQLAEQRACASILDGAGQAPNIIVDLRQQAGMTQELAQRAVRRAYGADGGRIRMSDSSDRISMSTSHASVV